MTAKEIAQLIENPHLCSAENISDLHKLAEKYPYAQTFPILLLQHLGRTNSLEFEEHLNKNAYKITDRSHLYFLINDKSVLPQEPLPAQESITEAIVEPEQTSEKIEEIIPVVRTIHEVDILPEETVVEEKPAVEEPTVAEKIEPTISTSIPTAGLRPEIEIDPNEDMSHFEVVEVQEMSFEPVTIDFEDDNFVPLQLIENIPVEKIEPNASTEKELEREDETLEWNEEPKLETIEAIPEKNEPIETVSEVEKQTEVTVDLEEEEIAPVLVEEEIIPEVIENTNPATPEIDELLVEEESIAKVEETLEVETIIEAEKTDPISEEIKVEPAEEDVFVTEMKSIMDFDPTADLFGSEEKLETEAEPAPNVPTEEKTIEKTTIEKINDPQMDELTSHAIAAGYHLPDLEKEDISEQIDAHQDALETEKVFEQKIADEKRSFLDWLKTSATTHSPEYQVKQQRTEEIVDRFIKEDPKITRISKQDEPTKKAAEFFKVSKIAKESLNEKVMPISETLAQIYEDQGNFLKAIDAYNQLMLLNPEKKSFFANRIKKLKNK